MAAQHQTVLKDIQQQRRDLGKPALLQRQFQKVTTGQNETPSPTSPQSTLRIMQWNLLAQALSQGDDNFVACPPEALSWEHRKLHIVEELLLYQPSILCLEEVDHFAYIKDTLAKVGYDGCFFPKPDSPCLYSDVHYGPDGCAVFWRKGQVSLEAQTDVVLKDDSGADTNQVAVICRFFSDIIPGKKVFVAVTHLKSKTPCWQLRHEQGKYLEQVLREKTPEDMPLIVCGDFNAEPTEPVYKTFQSSPLGLESSYRHLSEKLEEPSYTTWKIRGGAKGRKEFSHCIDYIWFRSRHLRPVSILTFPTGEEIGKDRLPSWTYPSDHLSLVVDFAFTG